MKYVQHCPAFWKNEGTLLDLFSVTSFSLNVSWKMWLDILAQRRFHTIACSLSDPGRRVPGIKDRKADLISRKISSCSCLTSLSQCCDNICGCITKELRNMYIYISSRRDASKQDLVSAFLLRCSILKAIATSVLLIVIYLISCSFFLNTLLSTTISRK